MHVPQNDTISIRRLVAFYPSSLALKSISEETMFPGMLHFSWLSAAFRAKSIPLICQHACVGTETSEGGAPESAARVGGAVWGSCEPDSRLPDSGQLKLMKQDPVSFARRDEITAEVGK